MMKRSLLICALVAFALASCKKDETTSPSGPTSQSDPVSFRLDSITLTGFNAMNGNGSYWDGGNGSNPADPFVNVYKEDVLLFTSTVASSASNTGSYAMSTPASGALPIAYGAGTKLEIALWDDDGDPNNNAPDYMGHVVIDDALTFFYGGDHAAGFTDLQVTGNNGITFLLTGTFVY
ncbi:MAG: hypothetical protein H6595_02035 [Flavobacteriales bacterium]|nr:hypothetical protein [Flavobacteriales bacterium]MCB9166237.1 hypothetical protein [Flavobacteriales bacterium]